AARRRGIAQGRDDFPEHIAMRTIGWGVAAGRDSPRRRSWRRPEPAGPWPLEEAAMNTHRTGAPGTVDQRPRWEGPPENRPRGYLPAVDDTARNRDAAGENLQDPERSTLGDAVTMRSRKPDRDGQLDRAGTVELRSGNVMPPMGLGTWKL